MLSENHIEQSLIAQLQGQALHSHTQPVPTLRDCQVAPFKQPPKTTDKKEQRRLNSTCKPGFTIELAKGLYNKLNIDPKLILSDN